MPRTWRHATGRAVVLAAALMSVPHVEAQITGTLIGVVTDADTGAPVAGAIVIATGRNMQGEQVAISAANGGWRLAFIPPGPYGLRFLAAGYLEGERSDLVLRTDHALKVVMSLIPSTVMADEQVVVVRAFRPAVDPTNAQTGIVLPRALTAALPLPISTPLVLPGSRSFEMAGVAAPGAEVDRGGVGFLGNLSLENRYLVDGFDVTDPNYGVNLSPLIVDFVQEVDVKTGNYMPKYGRAAGGIISAVTRSGSNEFHGSVFSNLSPRWAFRTAGEFVGSDGLAFWTRESNGRGAFDADFGFDFGGPIVRDRLWVHAGFAPLLSRHTTERLTRSNIVPDALGACPPGAHDDGGICRDVSGNALQETIPGATRRWGADSRVWQFTGKLTWLATPDQTFTLSTFGNPYTSEAVDPNTSEDRRFTHTREDIVNVTASWTGRFLSRRLLVEAAAGWMYDGVVSRLRSTGSFDPNVVPAKAWYGPGISPIALGLFEEVPGECEGPSRCLVEGYTTGGGGFTDVYRTGRRFTARLSGSYLFSVLGDHVADIGADLERTGLRTRSAVSGAATYVMVVRPTGVTANAIGQGYVVDDPGSGDVSAVWLDRMTFEPVMTAPALYAQDRWQPHPSLTINAGVRWESQSMYDRLRPEAIDLQIRDSIAPRLQVIWDPSGRGRSKIAAAWGRFYGTPPLSLVDTSYNTHFRARFSCPTAAQLGSEAIDPRNECAPVPRFYEGKSYEAIDRFRPVAPHIGGSYSDHFVLGAEYDLWRDVSIGIEYQGRRLGTVLEDMGTPDLDVFYVANPGVSRAFTYKDRTLDGRTLEGVDPATGRSYAVTVPRPERSYDGVTVKVTKLAARGLFGHASYTYSQLRGDYAGPAQLDVGQYLQPSQTVEYDLAEWVANRRGPLPGDHPHAVRIHGGWRWTPTSRIGVAFGAGVNAKSGTPVDVRGEGARDDLFHYGGRLAYVVPRGRGGRTPWVTQLDVRGQLEVAMRPPWGLRLTIDALNVLDAHAALAVDEVYTNDHVASILGATCGGNSAGRANPAAALTSACPDLAYLRTIDGRPVTVNRNWGRPVAFQSPLLLRFGAALTF